MVSSRQCKRSAQTGICRGSSLGLGPGALTVENHRERDPDKKDLWKRRGVFHTGWGAIR